MKKKYNFLTLIILVLSLTSCFWWNDDVTKAKQELLNQDNSLEEKFEENIAKYEEAEKQEKEKIVINHLTDSKFIELDSIDENDLSSLELEITWKTLVNVDKINVTFSNSSSKFPVDNYALKTFKSWDKTFLYRAFKKYETLDYGENKYIIEAYSWAEVSKIELIINIEEEKVSDSKNEEIVTEQVNLNNLPVWWDFWNPVDIWLGKFTYSDIKWLQVEKLINADLTLDSDSVNEFLADKIDWWFFWNSLRPVSWEEWVSFYLIRLEWDKYFYEKHYFTTSWFYWVLVLETWSWIDLNWLSEKNTQLKEKNADFTITTISDKLFKKL